ncbi:hypothetical protein JJC00_32445 [Bradyrhizobium diazoefficiens]|uniref:hypothetical protein n=1 Tax=Bradyrhizobium diazoefficiens TaxID=1355477 RepID=UPI001909ADC1|nr:hypothetical protein [Bradyrhizobium diazoefficiens]QQO33193.1 hypothetical protein JJC00_32445 [Bradyrhizobium diazoefficiens]
MPATKPSVAIIGTGIRTLSMIFLDLPKTETALELGRKLALETGRRVTVRDQEGAILSVFEPATPN